MLAAYEEIAVHIAAHEKFDSLLEFLAEVKDPALEHRAVSCVCCVCDAEGAPVEARAQAREALRARRNAGPLASKEAEAMLQGMSLDKRAGGA